MAIGAELLGMAKGAGTAAIGQGLGMLFGGMQDRRQLKQAGKLQELQIKGSKEMTDYNTEAGRKAQLAMWRDTGLPAQVEQAEAAGLSKALLYGGGGAGGATTGQGASAGSVSGQSAGDPNAAMANGMQLAMLKAQTDNLNANTKKTEEEANNIAGVDRTGKEETNRGTKFQNDLNDFLRENYVELSNAELSKAEVEAEKGQAEWKTQQAVDYGAKGEKDNFELGHNWRDPNSPKAKMLKAEQDKAVVELKKAKAESNIAKAEETIRVFAAKMAKQGLDPKSPWYVKFGADLLKRAGLNPL